MRDPLDVAYADLGDRGIECFQQALRIRGALHLVGEVKIRRDPCPFDAGQTLLDSMYVLVYGKVESDCGTRRWRREGADG